MFPFSLLSLGDFFLPYDPSGHRYTFVLLAQVLPLSSQLYAEKPPSPSESHQAVRPRAIAASCPDVGSNFIRSLDRAFLFVTSVNHSAYLSALHTWIFPQLCVKGLASTALLLQHLWPSIFILTANLVDVGMDVGLIPCGMLIAFGYHDKFSNPPDNS